MDASWETLIERIRASWPDVLGIYVFGTSGTGQERPESDVDIAVLPAAGALPPVEIWRVGQDLALLAHRDVDLVDLHAVSTVLRAQVAANGDLVYCGEPTACAEFEAHALADYARLNEERKGILEDIRDRGRIHG